MLVLGRKVGERIDIGHDIVITVVRIGGGVVRLGIDAPGDLRIRRRDLSQGDQDERSTEPKC
jgi:carbon storage regulator